MEVMSDKGSRTEDLIIKFYEDLEAAYAALKAGEVDIVGDRITTDLYADAIADSNIVLGGVGDRGMYQIDINNNCTIPSYRGTQSPTYGIQGAQFRKALTLLINKTYVVSHCCGGIADRIDQPIAYVQRGWRNTSCWYEDGTGLEFDPAQAASILDFDGWTQGITPNPHYDPSCPGSAEFLRTYPPDHPQKPGQDLDPLIYCIRTDDLRRICAGRHHCDNLRKQGIPVNQFEASSAVLYPRVMDNLDYHLYTSGWRLGRFPSLTLYGLYRTPYEPWSSNYVTGFRCDGGPNYPILDQLLFKARYPASYDELGENTKKLLGYGWCEMYITIPLFSPKGFCAWSSDLLGVVNAEEIGPINRYMLMNAYKVLGDPIRCGLAHAPDAMNKIYSSGQYDHQCLSRMDLYSGMDVHPYDQSIDQPGYVLNWTVDTWTDPDDATIKSNVTQTYRDDAWFVEPVTGNQLEHANMTHHYASIWYEYQLGDAWYNDGVIDIKTCRILDPYTIQILWNLPGYWNTYLGGTSIKSFNWYNKGNLSKTVTETLTVDASTGYVSCTEPVFYVLSAESEGTPLVLGTDYDIYKDQDGPHNADVRIINHSYLGASINITYLATDDAHGYYPGCLSWQDAFEGAGMYYAVDFVPGAGGYLTLRRNPFYPMDTPPLGEVDFTKKADGCCKIDIFDVVRSVSAYASQGISVPDSNWFPGADLAYPGGRIDIFDIVTIVSNYGREWDCYP